MPNPSAKAEGRRNSLNVERRRILRAEAVGLLLIALVIFLLIILRYGAHINWSAR